MNGNGTCSDHWRRSGRDFRSSLYSQRKSGSSCDPHRIGALEKAEKIENYYGLEKPLSGQELFDRGIAQAKALGVRVMETQVLGISGFDTLQSEQQTET